MAIWEGHQGKKCEEFFSGQDGIKVLAEISGGAEISTKNRFFVEISTGVEIPSEISRRLLIFPDFFNFMSI